jgi:diacylglycerol kinase (ATP)
MSGEPGPSKATSGPSRLAHAARYSWAGIRYALAHEPALREEMIALVVLGPASLFLPLGRIEHLLLVLALLGVILVEFLNSALEAAVDRISLERHPLSGRAKDLGSAAVFVSLVMAAATWAVILYPIVRGWVRSGP